MKNISEEARAVTGALQPKLGLRLAGAVAENVADNLRGGISRSRTPELLAHRIEETLLKRLYQLLGDSMVFRREDGIFLRIGTEDIPSLADDVLSIPMNRMPVSPQSFLILRDYAMNTGSPSAMRTLLARYTKLLPEQDRELLERLLEERKSIRK